MICSTSNEYAELLKYIKPVMFKYYKAMTEEDFYKHVAIIIHLGYRRISNYRLAWSQASLCYDQFVASIMSRNHFEGLMTFLHIVDSSTEQVLVNLEINGNGVFTK